MNITNFFNEKCALIDKADFTSEAHKELVSLILMRHGERTIDKIKLIDENDDYDSFYAEINNKGYCIKISFDQIPIFYEFSVLKGIEFMKLSPFAFDRGEIEYGDKEIFYTIQTFEFSENISEYGASYLLEKNLQFEYVLAAFHNFEPPKEILPYLDNIDSFLVNHKIYFDHYFQYVEKDESSEFEFIKKLYDEVYNEMLHIYDKHRNDFLISNRLVHGNLNTSTILLNGATFKIINYENCLVGCPFFDLTNLIFEMQMSGLKEHKFVSEHVDKINFKYSKNAIINQYKISKSIWTRKRFLDILKAYVKEVIIFNKSRKFKFTKVLHDFSNHYYRFETIPAFYKNKEILVDKFKQFMALI